MPVSAGAYSQVSSQNQRDRLIMDHLSLVRHVVGRLLSKLPSGVDVENLEAAGTLGLVEAAHRFDFSRGIKFETFAFPRIRGAVLDELRRNSPVPQELMEKIVRLRKFHQELPPPVTTEKLAEVSGMSVEEVLQCLGAMRMTHMVSLNGLSEDGQFHFACGENLPDQRVEFEEHKKLLAQGIAELPERERLIVTLYYLEDLRLKEIGEILKLSESRVSRLLTAAHFKLGEFMRAQEAAEV